MNRKNSIILIAILVFIVSVLLLAGLLIKPDVGLLDVDTQNDTIKMTGTIRFGKSGIFPNEVIISINSVGLLRNTSYLKYGKEGTFCLNKVIFNTYIPTLKDRKEADYTIGSSDLWGEKPICSKTQPNTGSNVYDYFPINLNKTLKIDAFNLRFAPVDSKFREYRVS